MFFYVFFMFFLCFFMFFYVFFMFFMFFFIFSFFLFFLWICIPQLPSNVVSHSCHQILYPATPLLNVVTGIKKMIFEGGGGDKKMNFGGFIHPWSILIYSWLPVLLNLGLVLEFFLYILAAVNLFRVSLLYKEQVIIYFNEKYSAWNLNFNLYVYYELISYIY